MLEHKSFGFEMKEVDESGRFQGYASTFGNVDQQGDIVEAGAFTGTLKETGGVVPILWQHDYKQVVGFGVKAVQDFKGLLVEGEFTLSNPQGMMAYSTSQHAQKVGHKMGLSIGFFLDKKDSWTMDGTIRRLKKINMVEYSLATFPANPKARMTAVKASDVLTERDFEELLREAGFSKTEALCITAKGFKTLLKERREAGSDQDELPLEAEAFLAKLGTHIDASKVDSWLDNLSRKSL